MKINTLIKNLNCEKTPHKHLRSFIKYLQVELVENANNLVKKEEINREFRSILVELDYYSNKEVATILSTIDQFISSLFKPVFKEKMYQNAFIMVNAN